MTAKKSVTLLLMAKSLIDSLYGFNVPFNYSLDVNEALSYTINTATTYS